MTARVAILACVYNGERFLAEQFASVARQTVTDIDLWISDDGSTDGSPGVLAENATNRLLQAVEKSRWPQGFERDSLASKGFGDWCMPGDDTRTGELFSYVDLEARFRHDHPLRVIWTIVN